MSDCPGSKQEAQWPAVVSTCCVIHRQMAGHVHSSPGESLTDYRDRDRPLCSVHRALSVIRCISTGILQAGLNNIVLVAGGIIVMIDDILIEPTEWCYVSMIILLFTH